MNAHITALAETYHGSHFEKIRELLSDVSDVNGIFLEMSVSYQGSIDNYISTGEADQRLENYFQGASKEGKNIKDTMLLILDFAKDNDIPVICIDSSKRETPEYNKKSTHGHYFLRGNSRDEDMFENVTSVLKDGEKWILIGGAKHLEFGKHYRSGEDTLGLRLKNLLGDGFEVVTLN